MPVMRWNRYAVAIVFITSGMMKLVVEEFQGIFMSLNVPYAVQTLFIVALIEIACGALIAAHLYVKQAAAPLIFIMIAALYFTKLPVLLTQGLLPFLFESRLDIVMMILLLVLFQHHRK